MELKTTYSTHFIAWRFYLVLAVISLAVLGLSYRIFYLAILNQPFLKHEGDERIIRLVSTSTLRGMIFDRNGFPLAVSSKAYAIWINPKHFHPTQHELATIANLLGMTVHEINAITKSKQKREFAYLKRGLSPQVAQQLRLLMIPGLYTQETYKRYYPEGEVAAHVIGFTNVDDLGQEGIELGYNQWLQSIAGRKRVIKDRLGRVIDDVADLREQKPGNDLVLSIDKRIQFLAYQELLAGVLKYQAVSGSIVVLDVKTGEVLAMVNQPAFNPNRRPIENNHSIRNRAITDSFEPGSTIKAFTIAAALESGLYKVDTELDTSPGWMRVGRNVVRDEKNNGKLTLERIVQISSNMGAAKVVLSLKPDQLWELLHAVGFGEITGIGFPGEQSGSLQKTHDPFSLATLSFGYGLSVTTLQLARAYAIIANDGIKLPVSLLKVNDPPQGERVLSEKVAREMRVLLESVLAKGGTAVAARVPGYQVSGKSGTSIMAGNGGYQKHHYTSSFVGMAPSANPRIVVAVVLHDPQGKQYYGGVISAPVFQKVMADALRILGIPPTIEAPPK